MSLELWLGFLLACLAISLSPGPGAFASLASGLRNGFWRGYWVVIGLQLGLAALLVVVAAGVGTLIVSSPLAFAALRWGGVAYLAWIGLMQWGGAGALIDADVARQAAQTRRSLLLRGFLVDAANPKALLFLLAVVPQFIDPGAAMALPAQYLVLGATMIAVDLIVMAGYTALAVQITRWLHDPSHVRRLNRGVGLFFLLAAASLAALRSH